MMSGRRLLLALAGIVCVTAIVPPAIAWALNQRRLAQTAQRVESVSGRIGPLVDRLRTSSQSDVVLCGSGRLPDADPDRSTATHRAWLDRAGPVPDDNALGPDPLLPADAWGRCLLVNVGAPARDQVLVLSAGPNGVVDTPIDGAVVAGDDIAAVVK